MDQFLFQVSAEIAENLRKKMKTNNLDGVNLTAMADNRHFTFHIDGKDYPAALMNMPTIVETHKTFDEKAFYKSGEIGQMLVVFDNEEQMEEQTKEKMLPSGITAPATNVVRRKFLKARKPITYPKEEVARVEEELVRIMPGGVVEDIQEELVEFRDWMVDEENPNGILITDEMEFIQKVPEYLDLTSSKDDQNEEDKNSTNRTQNASKSHSSISSMNNSRAGTPSFLDSGTSEVDYTNNNSTVSSANNSNQPSPIVKASKVAKMKAGSMSKAIEKDPISLGGTIQKLESIQEVQSDRPKYENDPAYLQLVSRQNKLKKELAEVEADLNDLQKKIDANQNIVVKTRFKQQYEAMSPKRQQVENNLKQINAAIEAYINKS